MKRLPELLACYENLDLSLEEQRRTASNESNLHLVERQQRTNDHAYFLLCWGQLETEIDSACREAIRRRRENPDWLRRRGWDLYNPEDKRLSGLSFEDRAKLVLDTKAKGKEWQAAMQWYNLRNFIAHGGSHEERIDLDDVAAKFFEIQAAIVL